MSYESTILATPGLIGYWPLDEASGVSAADLSSGNTDGTVTGAVFGAASIVPNTGKTCLYFNDQGDNVSIGATGAFDTDHITVEGWFKKDSGLFQFPDSPIMAYRAAGGGGGWVLQSGNPTTTYHWYVDKTGFGFEDVTNTLLLDDTVYHIVGTYDGHRNRLYRNGALVATHGSDRNAVISKSAAMQLMIGKSASATATHQGWIASVSLYNVALDPATITAHYDAGIAAPSSGNPYRRTRNQFELRPY
jgi:hypothetical protein